jgi:regulator of sigma E protease
VPSAHPAIAIAALLAIGTILLIVHELGHYLAARAVGLHPTKFAIGFGPCLFERTDRRGTTWRLCLLPVGGYVVLRKEPDGPYRAKPTLARIAVILAGPGANLLLAIALYAGVTYTHGITRFLPIASVIEPGSAAAVAAFHRGDRILAANGTPASVFEDLRPVLAANPGRPVTFQVLRGNRPMTLTATLAPRVEHGRTIGHLGITSQESRADPAPLAESLEFGITRSWRAVEDTARGLRDAVRPGASGNGIAGPSGMTQLTAMAAQNGIGAIAALAGFLSINLMLMNLLPVPILDGGALLLALAELLRRRPTSEATISLAYRATAIALAAMMIVATVRGLVHP